MKPNCPEAPEKVLKAIIPDLDKAFYPTEIPAPYMEIIHDRIMLEIMRGCTRGCRFCQAGILYRPVRERSLEHLVELAQQLENTTGYEEISLSSLSSGDYTCLAELIRELIRRLRREACVDFAAVAAPGQRAEGFAGGDAEGEENQPDVRTRSRNAAPARRHQQGRDRRRPDEQSLRRLPRRMEQRQAVLHDGAADRDDRGLWPASRSWRRRSSTAYYCRAEGQAREGDSA